MSAICNGGKYVDIPPEAFLIPRGETSKTLFLPTGRSLSTYGSCRRRGWSCIGHCRHRASRRPGPHERAPRGRPPPFRAALVHRRRVLLLPALPPLPLPPRARSRSDHSYPEVPRGCQGPGEAPVGGRAPGPLARLPLASPGRRQLRRRRRPQRVGDWGGSRHRRCHRRPLARRLLSGLAGRHAGIGLACVYGASVVEHTLASCRCSTTRSCTLWCRRSSGSALTPSPSSSCFTVSMHLPVIVYLEHK